MSAASARANRKNALKSTGPITAAGKDRVCQNAFKTGIYAEKVVIQGESIEDLHTLRDEYYNFYPPQSPLMRDMLDDLIDSVWMRRRKSAVTSQFHERLKETTYELSQQYPLGHTYNDHLERFDRYRRIVESTCRRLDKDRSAFLHLLAELPEAELPEAVESEALEPEAAAEPETAPVPTEIPTPQPAEATPDTQNGFVSSTPPPAPKPMQTAAEIRALYGLRPRHPLDPYECPACKTRGRLGFQCGYEPKRRPDYDDNPEECQNAS